MARGALHDGLVYYILRILMLRLIMLNSEEFRGLSFPDTLKDLWISKKKMISSFIASGRKSIACTSWVIKEGNETENKTVYKPATIQTATMNARKIFAGNSDVATITRIDTFVPVVCPLWSFRGPDISGKFCRNLCFLIVYIQLHQIDIWGPFLESLGIFSGPKSHF